MRSERLLLTSILGLAAAACAAAQPLQTEARLSALPPLVLPNYGTLAPKTVRLVIAEPRVAWGPVTIVQQGSPPVRLSEQGVAVESTGSSAPARE